MRPAQGRDVEVRLRCFGVGVCECGCMDVRSGDQEGGNESRGIEETRNGGDEEAMGQGHAVSIIPPCSDAAVLRRHHPIHTTRQTTARLPQSHQPKRTSGAGREGYESKRRGMEEETNVAARLAVSWPAISAHILATSVSTGDAMLIYLSVLLYYPDRKVADFLVARLPNR